MRDTLTEGKFSMKTGFTLIELMIVVTVLAILTGAAIPFVTGYVEDSRISKAKSDLEDLRTSLSLYESKREVLYPDTSPLTLYKSGMLTKVNFDPWSRSYIVDSDLGKVFSAGSDGVSGTGDDIVTFYQPVLSVTSAVWLDADQSSSVNLGDEIFLRFTRPLKSSTSGICNVKLTSATLPDTGNITDAQRKEYRLVWTSPNAPDFEIGKDSLIIDNTTTFADSAGNFCRPNIMKLKPR